MNERQIAANPHESLDEDGPPFEIANGPTAGHEHREVIEGECGNCGFDRLLVSRKHGEGVRRCLLCDSYTHSMDDGEWHQPKTDFDELKRLREWADNDGNVVEKVGEYGPSSQFTHGTEVFAHTDTKLLKIFEHPSDTSTERTTFRRRDLHGLLRTLERYDGFVTEHVREHMDGKQIAPDLGSDNPNAVDAGIIKTRFSDPHSGVRIWIAADHVGLNTPPIHFSPDDNGVNC